MKRSPQKQRREITHKGKTTGQTSDFSTATVAARKQGKDNFKILRMYY